MYLSQLQKAPSHWFYDVICIIVFLSNTFYLSTFKFFDPSINYLDILFCSGPVNISCLPRLLQDILARCLPQDLFKSTSCKLVLKMSWKTKKCHTKEFFKMSSVRHQHVFTKENVGWVLINLSLSKFPTLCAEQNSISLLCNQNLLIYCKIHYIFRLIYSLFLIRIA